MPIPLRICKAKDNRLLRNEWNIFRLFDLLPNPAEREEVPGGHYVFLAPCSEQLKAAAPELCMDAPGLDRKALHASLNAEIVDFFDRNLGPERN